MAAMQERDEREHVNQESGERVGADLARTLEEAARRLLERGEKDGVEHTLGLVVRGAIQTVPHVAQAGISLVERGGAADR